MTKYDKICFVDHCIRHVLLSDLNDMGCHVTVLQQHTDDCASQYKTRNCSGDILRSHLDLNYVKVIRNYSGNGHGKGEVDTAAGFLKTYRSQK